MKPTFVIFIIALCSLGYRGVFSHVIITQDDNDELTAGLPELESLLNILIEPKSAGCSVKLRGGIKDPAPLFIKPDTNEFYPYSANGEVFIATDKTIEFYCTEGFAAPLSGKSLLATCLGGNSFKIDGNGHNIAEIRCKKYPTYTARKSGESCNGGTTLIDVGFKLSNSRFLTQYEVCFDEDEEVTRYVHHTLAPGSNNFATGVDRVTFTTGGFFSGKNVNKLYTQNVQKTVVDKALGTDSTKFFNSKKNIFLSRGHMAAKADFVYSPEQRATFLFINTAPQWQTFNAGNWARVEDSVRAWGTQQGKFLECWTGVWGVTTLPDKNNEPTPLYLDYDHNGNGLIPVPKIYFRVVIEPSTQKGIVFVGVNNPHLSLDEIREDYILCDDVSDRINWITWKKADIMDGYSYACEVPEFREVVTDLPDFSVSGLLV